MRLKPDDRRQFILEAATEEAKIAGWQFIEREAVANRAQCTPTLINHYFKNMKSLKSDVMQYSVDMGIPEVIAHGLVMGDAVALSASKELKQRAKALIMG